MIINMYEEVEQTVTRYVGFAGNHRWDLAITQTAHFYGKSLVTNIQNGRTAILGKDDLEEDDEQKLHILMHNFNITDEEEGEELRDYLHGHL